MKRLVIKWGLILAVALLPFGGALADQPFDQGMVSITFDDGWLSQYTLAREPLRTNSFRGTFYLNVDPFDGWSGFMQQAQVEALIADGHEIGNHTISHADLVKLNDAAALYELAGGRDALAARFGLATVPSFASPFGSYDSRVLGLIAQVHGNHRTVFGGLNWRDGKPFELRAQDVGYQSLAAIKSVVDSAVAQRGWAILILHEITAGPAASKLDYSKADLEALLAHIRQSGARVVTVAEGTALMGGVQPPPPPPASAALIDDFEDLDTVSRRGTAWYAYADDGAGGNSQASAAAGAPGTGGSTGALTFTWQMGTAITYPYAGLGLALNQDGAALGANVFEGVQVSTLGAAGMLRLIMDSDASLNGYASYQAPLPAASAWSTQALAWAAFRLPAWSPRTAANYPLLPARIVGIEVIPPEEAGPGSAGTLALDNVAFLEQAVVPPPPPPPALEPLIEDGEDGNATNRWGGRWFTQRSDTATTVTPSPTATFTMFRHNQAAQGTVPLGAYCARLVWKLGKANSRATMGTTLSADGGAVDVSSFAGLVLTARRTGNAGGYAVNIVMDTDGTLNGGVSYRAVIKPTTAYSVYKLDWSAFTLPSNSRLKAANYPLDRARIVSISFAPVATAAKSNGTLFVDDLGLR